jgi:pyridoxal phosphate enzyme (YggS family)
MLSSIVSGSGVRLPVFGQVSAKGLAAPAFVLKADAAALYSVKRMQTDANIEHNLQKVRSAISEAAAAAGRAAGEITLVGISKTKPASSVVEAVEAGLLEIGENRIQEAQGKIEGLGPELEARGAAVRWHMVGHLQRNKAKTAVRLFDMIQSIDSRRIAEAVSRAALESGKVQEVLIEVNTSGEPTKYGLSPDAVVKFVAGIADLKGLQAVGLMTVGPLVADPDDARPAFALLRGLGGQIEAEGFPWAPVRHLSMGMTGDLQQAIEEGSNMVRVGTAIFGRRA